MDHVLGEKIDKALMTEASISAVTRLGIDPLGNAGERLAFERLWQIKAAGINRERERGREVVCRTVGAFRRYINDLPVWGRASVVVDLAAGGKVKAERAWTGVPSRRSRSTARRWSIRSAARAQSSPISPDACRAAIHREGFRRRDVQPRLPVASEAPRARRTPPVYVAILERRGWTTLNHVVAVPATERVYESIARIVATQPTGCAR